MTEPDRFDEIKTHVTVMFESFRADIRLLAEGHASLAGAIDGLRVGQDELRAGYAELKLDVRGLRVGQDELRAGYAELKLDVRELRVGQDELRSENATFRQELQAFRTEVREEFRGVRSALHASHGGLDERVGRVERDVASLKKQVKGLAGKRGLFKRPAPLTVTPITFGIR